MWWLKLASLIPGAMKGIWNLGSQWLENRRKISEVKGELEVIKTELDGKLEITRLESGLEKMKQDGAWESIQATNSNLSWKDELWTIILALPLVLVSISPLVDMFMDPEPYVQGALIDATKKSLSALEHFPEWYVVLMFVAVGAAFGVRIWDRFRSQNGRISFVGDDIGGDSPQPVPVKKNYDINEEEFVRRQNEPAPVRDAIEQKIER